MQRTVNAIKMLRAPMVLVGLGATLVFAVPSRAQQQVDPDHFTANLRQAAPPQRKVLAHRRTLAASLRRIRQPGAGQASAELHLGKGQSPVQRDTVPTVGKGSTAKAGMAPRPKRAKQVPTVGKGSTAKAGMAPRPKRAKQVPSIYGACPEYCL